MLRPLERMRVLKRPADVPTIPRRVRAILNKYNATMLLPGVVEPILGPELVTNGELDSAAGWSLSGSAAVSGGVCDIPIGGTGWLEQGVVTKAATVYRVVATVSVGATFCGVWDSPGRSALLSNSAAGRQPGQIEFFFTANDALSYIAFTSTGSTATRLDNISVREILGYNHTRFSYQPGNYRESTGQTLAAADQQAGLVVDAARSSGVELVTGDSSTFDTGVGSWVKTGAAILSASGGVASVTNGANYSDKAELAISGSSGKTLAVEIDVWVSSGTVRVSLRQAASPFTEVAFVLVTNTARTRLRLVGLSPSGNLNIQIVPWSGSAGQFVYFDTVSVRELPGIHASQATSGFQPVLRRGLVNLLTYSNDLSNAVWTTTGASKVGSKFIEDTSASTHIVVHSTSGANGEPVTLAAVLEAAGRSYAHISISGATHAATINLSNGAVTAAAGSPIQISSANMGNGKWLVSLSGAYSTVVNQCNFYASADGVWANRSYTGDGVSGIYLHSAALFQGTVTAEEIIAAGGIPVTTSAPASSAGGIQSWQFDGSDDRLSLSAVPFQTQDVSFAITAFNPSVSDGTLRRLWEVAGNGSESTAGVVNGNVQWICRGDSGSQASLLGAGVGATGVMRVATCVNTGAGRILRVDGAQQGALNTTVVASSTANVATLGNRVAGDRAYSGFIHLQIFGKGTVPPSEAELQTLERWAAQLQGRSL